MGLLSKIIAANVTTRIVRKLNEKAREPVAREPVPRQQYIPANPTLRDRAAQLYRDNPKLVAGAGVAIAALVLQQMTRKRSPY